MPDELLGTWLACGAKRTASPSSNMRCPAFHHVSFNLEDWSAVGPATDLISCYNLSLEIGPTRHGITRGTAIYFFDPSGNRSEVFAGGYMYVPYQSHAVVGRD